jgi:hypothetical protein
MSAVTLPEPLPGVDASPAADSDDWIEEGVWTEAETWIEVPVETGDDRANPSPAAARPARSTVVRRQTEVAQASRPAAPPLLVITTQPAGARVTVNGVGWGTTPLTIRHLPPGEKRIRVSKAGYRSEERVISVDATGTPSTLRFTLRQALDARAGQ